MKLTTEPMSAIDATLIEYTPHKWQAICPRCGYAHKGPSSGTVESEAERCERICRQAGVPLRAYRGNERHRGDRQKLRTEDN